MRYYKTIDGQTVFFKEPIIQGGYAIYNPTEEMILNEGWLPYEEPEPQPYEPYPQLEPNEFDIISKVKLMMQSQISSLDDSQAIEVMELYPTWNSLIGKQVNQNDRLYYDNALWKVMQAHTVQQDWNPKEATSLFSKVTRDAGTLDNPIEYSMNMELIQGKYYREEGVEYLCTRDLAQSVWHLSDLVGQYVEIV